MAVEVCEIWWRFLFFLFSFLFSVIINFNCSITVCIPLALLEMRHSECEIGQHWVLLFLHRGTGKALLWFTSSLTLALCSPECHRSHHSVHSAIALCQHLVAMTTHSNAPKRRHRRRLVKAPRRPLSVTFLLGAISRRDSQCSFNSSKSTSALCPCPHIKHPPPPSILPSGFPGNCCRCDSPYHSVLIWVSNAKQTGADSMESHPCVCTYGHRSDLFSPRPCV